MWQLMVSSTLVMLVTTKGTIFRFFLFRKPQTSNWISTRNLQVTMLTTRSNLTPGLQKQACNEKETLKRFYLWVQICQILLSLCIHFTRHLDILWGMIVNLELWKLMIAIGLSIRDSTRFKKPKTASCLAL